jgi:hypothetical protein
MELARHPYVTASVALAAASMIAVTPVAPPPLPDVQVPAVQLTAATDLLGDVPGILGGLESAVAADLGSAGPLGSIGGLLDPPAGLVGAASDVSALAGASASPFVSTLLTDLAVGLDTLITTLGAAINPLAAALTDSSTTLLTLLGVSPEFIPFLASLPSLPLYLPVDFLSLLSLSVDVIGGQLGVWPCNLVFGPCGPPLPATGATSAASDLSALSHVSALPDVSTLLNPADPGTLLTTLGGDLTALLNLGDLGTLLNPADFAALFDPVGIGSVPGTLAADIPTMLLSLIP